MSRTESLPEAFVRVMARIAEIDDNVSSDDPDRHDYWRLKQLAEAFVADGLRRAADVHEVALAMKLRRSKTSSSGRNV